MLHESGELFREKVILRCSCVTIALANEFSMWIAVRGRETVSLMRVFGRVSCLIGWNWCLCFNVFLVFYWFDGDDLVSFCIGFPWYFGVFDSYARCWLCGVDVKVSTRGLAILPEHVRGRKQMLRDSVFRYAHQMPWLTKDGMVMTRGAVERWLRLV